jgi:hypothetical protein
MCLPSLTLGKAAIGRKSLKLTEVIRNPGLSVSRETAILLPLTLNLHVRPRCVLSAFDQFVNVSMFLFLLHEGYTELHCWIYSRVCIRKETDHRAGRVLLYVSSARPPDIVVPPNGPCRFARFLLVLGKFDAGL